MSASEVEAYLARRPEDQRAALQALREVIGTCLSGAEEVMSYAMPGFRLGGKMVAGYAGFARNCGFYPHSGNIIPQFADEIAALRFRHRPGAISFTPARPLP